MNKRLAALLLALVVLPASAGATMLGVQVKDTPAPEATAAVTDAPQSGQESAEDSAERITQEDMDAAALGGRVLMRGMEGEDVAIVQRRLYQLGYYLGEIDGVFGLNTRTAVYGFQRAHQLEKIDGKVGQETIRRMFAEDAIVKPTPTPTPSPTPSPTPTPTPTPVPTPVPTATPDMQGAPFALAQAELYVDDRPVVLTLGQEEDGGLLYPLCGVLGHMGYEHTYAAGSWQLLGRDGTEIALMTGGQDGLQETAMGSAAGVLFLADEESRVYVYAQEAYVTAALLEQIGLSVLLVGGIPVIH